MSEKMLKFVKIGQQNPLKREVGRRKEDFNEIYKDFINEKAKEQSSRCSQCGVPFCQVHCPLSNNIPDWLKLTAEGRLLLCLGQEHSVDLKHILRSFPEDIDALKSAIVASMEIKPKGHNFDLAEKPLIFRHMSHTGG